MPRVEVKRRVELPQSTAFKLSQTYGPLRYQWDPFVIEQHLLDGATEPGKGVQTFTRSRHRLVMITEYITYKPPSHVGMKMVKGPWFFSSFSGGWNFSELDDGSTEAIWRYNFTVRPTWLRRIAHPIGVRLLQRDMEKRLNAFVAACQNAEIIRELNQK